jgi:hypothetical protein
MVDMDGLVGDESARDLAAPKAVGKGTPGAGAAATRWRGGGRS